MSAHRTVKWMAIAAITFGAMTIISGGRALFGSMESREGLGNAVPFVLWFNFLAGFIYILAGTGFLVHSRWAVSLSLILAVSTTLIFAAFGIHITGGGAFEMRTVIAMTIRSFFWITVTVVSMRAKGKNGFEAGNS